MMSTLATLNVVLNGNISGFLKSMKDAENASKSGIERITTAIGSKMTAVGAELTRGLTLPLAGVGVAALKVAGDFESQMNILTVAVKKSGVSLEDMRNVAIKAGSDVRLVGVSSADVANAMTNFAKSGQDVNAILGDMHGYLSGTAEMGGTMRAAIDLAAASELNLDQASQLVVTTMSTFGVTAEEVGGMMNNYVQSADASVASVGDLAAAMNNAGPTMASFGFGLQDTNTALSILSTRGIIGSEAGTALLSMFNNMNRGVPESVAALEELNVSLYDQSGKMRSMRDIIGQLSKSMKGMTQKQRDAYVQTLAGTYGMKAMNTLLSEGTDGWDAMKESISGAATMQETATARTKGFNASMQSMKDTIETLLILIGSKLIAVVQPILQDLTNTIGQVADAFGKLPPGVQQAIVVAGLFLAALGPILTVGGNLVLAIGAIAGVLSGPLILAIGAVVAAGLVIAQNWETIWPQIQGVVEGVVTAIKSIIETVLGAVSKFVQEHGAEIQEFFKSAWERVGEIVQGVIAILKATIVPMLQGIANFVQQHGDAIRGALETAWNAIRSIVDTALNLIQGVVSTVLAAVNGDWETVWTNIRTFAEAVWTELGTVFTTFMTNILPAAWEAFKQVFQMAWDGFWGTSVPAAWESFKMLFQMAWDGFWGTSVPAAWESFKMLFQMAWDTFWGTTVPAIWEAFKATFLPNFEAGWNAVKTIVEGVWNGIVAFLQGAVNTCIGVINGLIDAFNNTIGKVSGEMPRIKEVAWTTQKELAAASDAMQKNTTAVTGSVSKAVTDMVTTVTGAVSKGAPPMFNPIKSSAEGMKKTVGQIIGDLSARIIAFLAMLNNAKNAEIPSAPSGGSGGGSGARALGGPVNEGWWYLHNNEYVLSAAMRAGKQAIPAEAMQGGQTRGPAPTANPTTGTTGGTDLSELTALLRTLPRDVARSVRDGLIQAGA
jgi:TP901 family phage tail tape measure protein